MPSWTTNRDDVKAGIEQGNWKVAYGRELTETDAAEGAVAAGVSIFTGEPGPVLAWLDELVTESIDQMEASIVATFTAAARSEAVQFAKGVITNLLQAGSAGVQLMNLFHFQFKAGVAQFIGQNYVWVPGTDVGSLITTGNAGGYWQFVPPQQISYCPYVGLRFDTSVGNPSSGTISTDHLQRIQWVGTTWYHQPSAQPGVWHQWDNQVPPHLLRTLKETGRDANFVYLRDQTPGSNLEIALGIDRQFYHYTDGNPGWHPDTQGNWQA